MNPPTLSDGTPRAKVAAVGERFVELPNDTDLEAERVLLAGYRRMSPRQKMAQVLDMNRAVEEMAGARIRAQYGPELSENEFRLRLATLRLDRETMVRVFGWDPEIEGY